MRLLRLPAARPLALRFLRTTVTSLTPFPFARLGLLELLPLRLGVGLPVSPPRSGSFSKGGSSRISQVPREPFRAFALLSDPGRISTPSPFAALRFCPRVSGLRRLQHQIILSRLNHTALAPAPYASCRHRCRLRNVRFRLVANLCRVGFFSHWVPVLCFRVLLSIRSHALPHILGLLDAT